MLKIGQFWDPVVGWNFFQKYCSWARVCFLKVISTFLVVMITKFNNSTRSLENGTLDAQRMWKEAIFVGLWQKRPPWRKSCWCFPSRSGNFGVKFWHFYWRGVGCQMYNPTLLTFVGVRVGVGEGVKWSHFTFYVFWPPHKRQIYVRCWKWC